MTQQNNCYVYFAFHCLHPFIVQDYGILFLNMYISIIRYYSQDRNTT